MDRFNHDSGRAGRGGYGRGFAMPDISVPPPPMENDLRGSTERADNRRNHQRRRDEDGGRKPRYKEPNTPHGNNDNRIQLVQRDVTGFDDIRKETQDCGVDGNRGYPVNYGNWRDKKGRNFRNDVPAVSFHSPNDQNYGYDSALMPEFGNMKFADNGNAATVRWDVPAQHWSPELLSTESHKMGNAEYSDEKNRKAKTRHWHGEDGHTQRNSRYRNEGQLGNQRISFNQRSGEQLASHGNSHSQKLDWHTCFKCGEKGHKKINCPNENGDRAQKDSNTTEMIQNPYPYLPSKPVIVGNTVDYAPPCPPALISTDTHMSTLQFDGTSDETIELPSTANSSVILNKFLESISFGYDRGLEAAQANGQEHSKNITTWEEDINAGQGASAVSSLGAGKEEEIVAQDLKTDKDVFASIPQVDGPQYQFIFVDQVLKMEDLLALVTKTNHMDPESLSCACLPYSSCKCKKKLGIIVNQRVTAECIQIQLSTHGIQGVLIYGGMDQEERLRNLTRFKFGKYHALITTMSEAKICGDSFANVHWLIICDLPETIDEFKAIVKLAEVEGEQLKVTGFYDRLMDYPLRSDFVQILVENNQPVPEWMQIQSTVHCQEIIDETDEEAKSGIIHL